VGAEEERPTSIARVDRDRAGAEPDDAALLRALHDEHAAALWNFVLHLTGGDRSRTEDVVISFSDEGQVQARIPRSGPDYDMPPVEQVYWRARPVRRLVVRDDLLITPVSAPGEDRRTAVAAFSLKTGTQLWRTAIDGDVVAVESTTGGLAVATTRLYLNELSPADGAVTATLPVRGEWWVFDVDLRKVSDRYAVVASDGTKEPPVVMVG